MGGGALNCICVGLSRRFALGPHYPSFDLPDTWPHVSPDGFPLPAGRPGTLLMLLYGFAAPSTPLVQSCVLTQLHSA